MSNNSNPLPHHYRSACDRFAAAHNLEALAARIGMSGHVLRNKFNQAQKHKLSGEDLIALYHASEGDETLFDGLLFECGLTAVKIPTSERAASLLHQVIELNANVASIGQRAVTLTERGRITRSERNTFMSAVNSVFGSAALLAHDIEARFQATPILACASDIALQAATL